MWLILLVACVSMEDPVWPGGTVHTCVGWDSDGEDYEPEVLEPQEELAWVFAGTVTEVGPLVAPLSVYPSSETLGTVCWADMAQSIRLRTNDDLDVWLAWTVEGPDGEDLSPAANLEVGDTAEARLGLQYFYSDELRSSYASLTGPEGPVLYLSDDRPWEGAPVPLRWGESTGVHYQYGLDETFHGVFLEVTAVGGGDIAPGEQRRVAWEGSDWTVRNHGLRWYDEGSYPDPDGGFDQPVIAWR